MKRWSLGVLALVAMMTVTSCKNGNLFGKLNKDGDGGSAGLQADAAAALNGRDFSRALSLYESVLSQDPGNSEALYGAAASALGTSGVDLATIISNVLRQTSAAPSVNSLNDLVAASRTRFSPSANADPSSLLFGIDLDGLSRYLPVVKCRLQKIVLGQTDGKIRRDDVDVLINFAVVCILDAAVAALEADVMDVVNNGGNYTIVKGANFASACGNTTLVERIGQDMAIAYRSLNTAAVGLNLGSDKIIPRFRADVAELIDKVLNPANTSTVLEPACITVLDGIGITHSTFASYTGDFSC